LFLFSFEMLLSERAPRDRDASSVSALRCGKAGHWLWQVEVHALPGRADAGAAWMAFASATSED